MVLRPPLATVFNPLRGFVAADDDDDDDDASGSDLYSRVEMEARIDSMRRQVPFFADDDDDDVLPDSFGGDDMEDADGSSIMADDSGISRTFFA
mmetsp:Transcript_11455/g.20916  ORF Transcript_11455/g.20916 Transcript_11455/m.20916 type:complete len:94 (-) Transcript_11455:168-449(-)